MASSRLPNAHTSHGTGRSETATAKSEPTKPKAKDGGERLKLDDEMDGPTDQRSNGQKKLSHDSPPEPKPKRAKAQTRKSTKKTTAPNNSAVVANDEKSGSDNAYDPHLSGTPSNRSSPQSTETQEEGSGSAATTSRTKKPSALNEKFVKNITERELTHDEAWAIIREYEETIGSYKRRYGGGLKARKKGDGIKATRKDQLQDKNAKSEKLKEGQKALRDELDKALEKRDELQRQLDSVQPEIQKLFDKAVNNNQRDFHVDTDEKLVRALNGLFAGVNTWTKKYILEKWDSNETKDQQNIVNALRGDHKPPIASAEGIEAVTKQRIPPGIVAGAIVNRSLTFATLANPFRILATAQDFLGGQESAKTLKGIHEKLSSDHPTISFKFRTFSMMAIKPTNVSGLDNIARSEELAQATWQYAQVVAKETVQEVACLLELKNRTVVEAEEALANHVTRFIGVAVGLHAQYIHTSFASLDRLKFEKFKLNHDLMTPHGNMGLKDSDQDDTPGMTAEEAGVLGSHPHLLITPLVSRTGDDKGEDWGQSRVIEKALVFICTSKMLEEIPKPSQEAEKNHQISGQADKESSSIITVEDSIPRDANGTPLASG